MPTAAFVYFDEEWRAKNNYDLEVAYWRKCWNVRNIIFELLNIEDFNDSRTPMSIDDVVVVIKALQQLNAKNYTDRGSCIWDWPVFRRINRRNIIALNRLVRLMKKNDNIEVYFYDSW